MRRRDEPAEIDPDARRALDASLRTLHLPAGPFADDLPARTAFLPDGGTSLGAKQLAALGAARGDEEAWLVEHLWSWDGPPPVLAAHRMSLAEGYPPMSAWRGPGLEHAIVALDGAWAVLTDNEWLAVAGGSAAWLAAALPGLGPSAGAPAAAELLEVAPEWGPGLLAHLAGAAT